MNYDLKGEIYGHLAIDDLANACKIDKESISICSSKIFWTNYFRKHQLPLPENINYYADWIDEFYIAQEVKQLMMKLENQGNTILNKIKMDRLIDIDELWKNGIKFQLNDQIDDLFIFDNIDSSLNDVLDQAEDYDLSNDHIEVLVKYDPDYILYFGNAKHNIWKMIYELYDDNGEVLYRNQLNMTNEQVRKYLANVVYLKLEEVEI